MNHAFVHSTLPPDYPIASEQDYLVPGRGLSNNSHLPADVNGALRHSCRTGNTNPSVDSPLAVPGHHVFGYTAQQATLHDATLQSTTQLLTPPESCSGSGSIGPHSAASPYVYSDLPTVYQNNATGAETFSNASSAFLPQPLPWNDRNMPDYRQQRVPALPPPNLSSSTSHSATYSMPPSSMGSRLLGDLGPASSYSMNRPGYPPLMSHDQDLHSYPPFNPPPRPHVPLGTTFPPQMQTYNPTIPGLPLDQGSRSSNMGGQDGPPFEDTKVIYPVITARNQQLTPKIDARIQKGFFKVDQKWTCYRRNYFTVSCSFSLKPTPYDPPLYLRRPGSQQHEPINFFAMQISAKTAMVNNQGSEARNLIQHTPKRDRATESVPDKVVLQPAQPSIMTNSGSYHGGGGSTMYSASSNVPSSMMADYNSQQYISAQHPGHPHSHTFERIQFQKATANNGKRRAQQQYFHVVVKLFADVGRHGDLEWVEIATAQSHPMVVRGRSPGHYKDNRRDSSTSMDRDRGAGGGGDGPGGAPSMGPYLGPPHGRSSTMDWESSHRNSSHMGGSYRRTAADCSPTSATSLDSSSSSCCEPDSDFLSAEAAMNSSRLVMNGAEPSGPAAQKTFTPLLGHGSYSDTRNLTAHRRRNPFYFGAGAADDLDSLRSGVRHSKQTGGMEMHLHQALCLS